MSPTAGLSHTLTCDATTKEHLIVAPILNWVATEDIPDVTESVQSIGLSTSSRSLTFNPLRTSHGGPYTCQASINILLADIIDRNDSTTKDVIVQSMFVLLHHYIYGLNIINELIVHTIL